MSGVTTTIVDIVDVISVRHSDMAAAGAVGMVVALVHRVFINLALVEMPVMGLVQVPVVDIVDVISVRDRNMAAAITMQMVVVAVFGVGSSHRDRPFAVPAGTRPGPA